MRLFYYTESLHIVLAGRYLEHSPSLLYTITIHNSGAILQQISLCFNFKVLNTHSQISLYQR
uniref:Uncharacterized protein n=1 Tax=Anguilla anguilla TaxID=7936 RepID=A0A0E9XM60_ANGAN